MLLINDPRCVLLAGDAFVVLPSLPDNFCGLVCSDSPYGERTHAKYAKERRADGAAPRVELTFKHLTKAQVEFLAAQYVRLSQGWIIAFTDDRSIGWWGDAIVEADSTFPAPRRTHSRAGTR